MVKGAVALLLCMLAGCEGIVGIGPQRVLAESDAAEGTPEAGAGLGAGADGGAGADSEAVGNGG